MSTCPKSVATTSCYMSVRTPNTHYGTKSKYSSGMMNKTVDNWYKRSKSNCGSKSEIYSQFSKGNLNRSTHVS
jgi:hypothetical protein